MIPNATGIIPLRLLMWIARVGNRLMDASSTHDSDPGRNKNLK